MANERITAKERGLIKGALRRAFSRSELRQQILDASTVTHSDPAHPRVKKWSTCSVCKLPKPKYKMAVDHIEPLIPTNKTLEQMSWDEIMDRLWCEANNLQVICEPCHDEKTKREREERKNHKRGTTDVKRKAIKRSSLRKSYFIRTILEKSKQKKFR